MASTLMVSDTVSEVSTRGSSMCSDSREDLREFAMELGLPDADHLSQERFRVDRRKLEQMLLGDTPTQETAAVFFQRIMDETNTLIIWPTRLKIGSKSKNDPHVRIAGRPEDVKEAKAKVMEALDVRSNRVTMKLNVSYTDHSHIIGKGGLTIKRVMEATGCHIHFPDSNRSNPTEKSNQVSIAGDLQGVEQARARVRELTPLMFSFELPVVGTLHPLPDPESPLLLSIQKKYNVQVMFRTRPKLHATLVVVKGSEWEVAQVKEATLLLISHMCDSLADQVNVHMSIEISPQHHPIVVGKNSDKLKMIMRQTATQIMFPDASDPNIPSIKKSYVLITGAIHNVYVARQQLLGALPLVLMFDIPEESMVVDTEHLAQIMQCLDVLINVRHKPKQNTMSVIIKGIERNASNIYEARRQLLDLKEPTVEADIPASYKMLEETFLLDYNYNVHKDGINPFSMLTINTGNANMLPMSSPSLSPGISSTVQSPGVSPSGLFSLGLSWGQLGTFSSSVKDNPSLTPQQLSQLLSTPLAPQQHQHNQQLLLQQLVPRMQNIGLSHNSNSTGRASDVGRGSCSSPSLGYQSGTSSRLSGSTQSLECRDFLGYSSLSSNAGSTVSSPAASPRLSSPVSGFSDPSKIDLLSFITDKSDGNDHYMNVADYQRKKALAARAMQKQPTPEVLRVPTSSWSGYGFSHSSPSAILKQMRKEYKVADPREPDSSWPFQSSDSVASPSSTYPSISDSVSSSHSSKAKESIFGVSNYLDSVSSSSITSSAFRCADLTSLLISMGMEKYIPLFKENEVDLPVFLSLTDKDLREIGVRAFGARRTMLLAIAQHQRFSSPFRGSAAPGAERKGSSSTNENNSPTDFW